ATTRIYILYFNFLFFFSSRRRHTRFSRDWSSDVCSSDLLLDLDGRRANFLRHHVDTFSEEIPRFRPEQSDHQQYINQSAGGGEDDHAHSDRQVADRCKLEPHHTDQHKHRCRKGRGNGPDNGQDIYAEHLAKKIHIKKYGQVAAYCKSVGGGNQTKGHRG